ncbi:hypothetical protein DOTSEDRAFT_39657 [Dothistroma septosporum NZE10]|uniref:Uncharacterized protein n=1 Tax=Dothistroma septosporum (strain NZE10 / CBS 128990) TaxID=675120 RepID=M2XZL4_DOTSN|nr:hypothetical protein DOTSEDRAFT_39657 [Dothistroma septosporum NZE10]
MAPKISADVYVISDEGVHIHVGKTIDKQNFMLLSSSARKTFERLQQSDKHLFLLHESKPGAPFVEPEAARIVCKWINSYDPNEPMESQVLTLNHIPNAPGGPTLQQVVRLYHTAYAFNLYPSRRGNMLRQEISRYTHDGPLSANEFRMLHDLLTFDSGLLVSAQHFIMYAQANGFEPPKDAKEKHTNKVVQDKSGKWHVYSQPDPEEFVKIVAFAKERGIWKGMKEASRTIMREVRRLRDHAQLDALVTKIAAQNALIAALNEEDAMVRTGEAAKKAEEAAKVKAEQEKAGKAKQKPHRQGSSPDTTSSAELKTEHALGYIGPSFLSELVFDWSAPMQNGGRHNCIERRCCTPVGLLLIDACRAEALSLMCLDGAYTDHYRRQVNTPTVPPVAPMPLERVPRLHLYIVLAGIDYSSQARLKRPQRTTSSDLWPSSQFVGSIVSGAI